jgi:cytoskeleton protein RodZ
MSEQDSVRDSTQDAGPNATAGEMLRAAREAHGIHIAALAASIKVTVKKLELLESDRIDELPDSAFARALAQAVCRFLKIDPAPVLAKLPGLGPVSRLEHVAQGLNQPFRDTGTRTEPYVGGLSRLAVWVPLLLVIAAILIWLMPAGWIKHRSDEKASSVVTGATPANSAPPSEMVASVPGPESAAPVPGPVTLAPGSAAPSTAAAAASAAPASVTGAIVLRTTAQSWVEVIDGSGRTLISRLVPAGETVGLDGSFPMRLKVGNAKGTQVEVRGHAFDMGPHVRDNVARFEVK